MGDDAHRVTFEEVAFDRRCWGSGTTGQGCGREATLPVGLCASCHDAISRRIQEHAERPAAGGPYRILELDVEVHCAGGGISGALLWVLRHIASWDGQEPQPLEESPPDLHPR